ncbi:MAG: hypothetical protein KQH83_10545 [Actinobacteria bacterium]|nr:hypothetical protein [Actinomycetota bacterium]
MVNGPTPPPAQPPGYGTAHPTPPPKPVLPWVVFGIGVAAVIAAVVVVLNSGSSDTTAASSTTAGTASTATTAGTTTTGAATTSSTTTTTVAAGDPDDASGTWAVMMYGLGDNNLEQDFLNDLEEMRAATDGVPNLTFLVLADRAEGETAQAVGAIGDWTGAKLIRIEDGAFTDAGDWGEPNMGDPATLIDFLEAAGAAVGTADHHALIFWDHGSMQGIGPDASHDDLLESWEFAAGIEAGLASTGMTLDFLGFDACLMGSLEIASVTAPYATYMIASEDLEPGDGWQYSGFTYLAQPDPTVLGLGQSILDAYYATSAATRPTVTLSMLDLRVYDEFSAALSTFTTEALATIDVSAAEIGRRRDSTVKFGSNPNPDYDWFMVDLGQLLTKLGRTDAPVADEAAAALDVLQRMVVGNVHGDAAAGARGMAVHFPSAPEYHYPQWYAVYGEPSWSQFLDAYFDAGRSLPEARRADLVRTSPITTFLFDDYGLEVTAEITEGSLDTVVAATLWSGVPQDDGSVIFYSSDQGVVEGFTAIGFYDLTRMVMDDGADQAVAFQQLTANEDYTVYTLTVPLGYRAPIDSSNGIYDDPIDVVLKAVYDLETDAFSIGLFSAANLGTTGAFDPAPDGLLFPKLPVWNPGTGVEWVFTTDVGLWADLDAMNVDFVPMDPGTPLYAELTVTDYGGNTAVFDVTTEVP